MWSIVAVLSAALAFWGVSTFFAVREAPPVQIKDNGLMVDSQTLDVSAMTKVSANLKLVPGSCPLQLSIVFKTADGKSAGEERLTVRRSSVKKFSVPKGCKTAIFELRKNSVADNPIIESFKPMGQ
jgi:hypothetical protein